MDALEENLMRSQRRGGRWHTYKHGGSGLPLLKLDEKLSSLHSEVPAWQDVDI